MRVLVACEYSGQVRDCFNDLGHTAMSCDLLPTDSPWPGLHYQGDIRDVLYSEWDLLIAFPPCTHLAASGVRHFPEKIADGRQAAALDFVRLLMSAKHIPRRAYENPVGIISTHIRQPDQIIQPFQFGHNETKKTCLWLDDLPALVYNDKVLEGREQNIFRMPQTADRWKKRSLTFYGIAAAMAEQWGCSQPEQTFEGGKPTIDNGKLLQSFFS